MRKRASVAPVSRRAGFTILEVLIASVLLIVGLVGSIALIGGLVMANRSTHSRDVAYELIQQTFDDEMLTPLNAPTAPGLANQFDMTANSAAATAPSLPICYASSDDVIADRPIPCLIGMPAAFILRTWNSCVATGLGDSMPLTIPAGIGGGPSPALPILAADTAATGTATMCFLQAEVTWPIEQQTSGTTATFSGAPKYLFQEVDPYDNVSYTNHVYAAMLREQ